MKSQFEPALFGVVIYDDVEAIDLGATFGVLSMAMRVLPKLSVVVVAQAAGVVTLSNGLRVYADYSFADCPAVDVLIVCGGAGWKRESANEAMLSFVRKVKASIVSSVCTGGLILAGAGLLDGKPATTRRHAVGSEKISPLDLLRQANRAIAPCESVVVDSGPIVTGGGVSLSIDTTLHLVGRVYGKKMADEVTEIIEYSAARRANYDNLGVVGIT